MKLAAETQLLGTRTDRSDIAKLESGIRSATDTEIIAIARILNVSMPQLFEDSTRLFRQLETQ
jgi:transcriptional regulator with XRE-family HTH domain